MQKIRNEDINIGNNLRLLRTKHNFTQDQLIAQLLTHYGIDMTRNHYSRIETGELNIPINVLVALHQLYDCSYDDFFIGLDSKFTHNNS